MYRRLLARADHFLVRVLDHLVRAAGSRLCDLTPGKFIYDQAAGTGKTHAEV